MHIKSRTFLPAFTPEVPGVADAAADGFDVLGLTPELTAIGLPEEDGPATGLDSAVATRTGVYVGLFGSSNSGLQNSPLTKGMLACLLLTCLW
jgi:hypothetical protein